MIESQITGSPDDLPDHDALSALRAWYEGVPSREAVARYLPDRLTPGRSARGVIGEIGRSLIHCALVRHRDDLAALFRHRTAERVKHARRVAQAIEALRAAKVT